MRLWALRPLLDGSVNHLSQIEASLLLGMADMHRIIEFKHLTTIIDIYKRECASLPACHRSGWVGDVAGTHFT